MSEIGGYFELELAKKQEYHSDALRINTSRNALEYILLQRKYSRVHIPSYSCVALLAPFRRTKTEFCFYQINRHFEAESLSRLEKNEAMLYINYFGICDTIVKELAANVKNLIIDNSQSFYSLPHPGIDTFYSARKFFGVPDGAYLYTTIRPENLLEEDRSWERFKHLLLRIDRNTEAGFDAFQENERLIDTLPLKAMSPVTRRLLSSIDYESIQTAREKNFRFLHEAIGKKNDLPIDIDNISAPLVYPFLVKKGRMLRQLLLNHKIYCATYWPNLNDRLPAECFEMRLVRDMVALPVDQRYDIENMNALATIINNITA